MFFKCFKIWARILKIAIKDCHLKKSAKKRGQSLALILVSAVVRPVRPKKSAKN